MHTAEAEAVLYKSFIQGRILKMNMKKIGLQISILMAVTLSFCLSLTGNLTSKDGFKLMPFIITFVVSFIISLIIGMIVPMKKVEDGLNKAFGLQEHSIPSRLVSALASDLIYTPVITLAMIALVRKMAMKASNGHAQLPPFGVMFVKSLILCFIVAYIIIFIVSPIFTKLVMKKNGAAGPPAGGPPSDRK
jgi:large-conductance mechanosensitive channel